MSDTVRDIDLLIPKYLIHSYLYYEHDVNLISDEEFNGICKDILNNYDDIDHYHKHLVDKESLKANTGYDIKYPTIVKYCAILKYKDATGVDLLINYDE